jgi:Zn-dependent membrane protease YugP
MDSYYEGMDVHLRSRLSWLCCIVGIIAMGILSRVIHTGIAVFDKYLGDALYAMMVYGILRLLSRAAASAVCAMVVMTAIELFQLTTIPAQMLASERMMTRICARLMGVEFSFLDLLAYGVGIGSIYLVDSSQRRGEEESSA